MNSTGHRELMLTRDFSKASLGVAYGNDTLYAALEMC